MTTPDDGIKIIATTHVTRGTACMMDSLPELFDLEKLHILLNGFCKATGVTAALIDTDGQLLVSSTRPTLCTKYNDTQDVSSTCRLNRINLLQSREDEGRSFCRPCPHGLMHAVEPVILEGKLLGGLLIGQVFLKKPNFDFCCEEAKRQGFDTDQYLADLYAVPVVSEEQFENSRQLMLGVTSMLAAQGLERLKSVKNEQTACLHAERFIREIKRQQLQLKLYAQDDASCTDLLNHLLESARTLTDSSVAYVYTYNEDTRLFTLDGWSQSPESQSGTYQKQTICELDKSGLWGEVVRQRKPLINNDHAATSHLQKDHPDNQRHLLKYLNLPIFRNGKIIAVIGAGNKTADYTEEDINHFNMFMNGAWNLVERRKAEDELKVAKELAETSCRLKTQLLKNLSHELRTPLNGIVGGTQLLRFTSLTDEQDAFLTIIEEASANELTLVNNLLELVRMESVGIHAEKALFSVQHSIEDAVKVHESSAQAKGITLKTELPDNMPDELIGDKTRVRQILYILLGNAVKFTSKGTITLKCALECRNHDQIIAHFSIIDTGIGIVPEQLPHIFEQFVQSDMSDTRDYGGLGLGLTICHHLARALGGAVSAESTPGVGSTFHLELPFQLAADTKISLPPLLTG